MSVVCQCPSCKAKYQVGDQYAGHTIRCPKCAAAVTVSAAASSPIATTVAKPASAGAAKPVPAAVSARPELPRARAVTLVKDPPAEPVAKILSSKAKPAAAPPPAESEADDAANDVPPPAGDDLGFLNDVEPVSITHKMPKGGLPATRHAETKDRAAAPPKEEASDDGESGGDFTADLASFSSQAPRLHKTTIPHHPKKKNAAFPPWLITAIAGGVVAVIGVVALTVYLLKSNHATNSPGPGGVANKNSATAPPAPKGPLMTVDWSEHDRTGAWIIVNGERKDVPAKGPIEIRLEKSQEQQVLVFVRPGYKSQTFRRVVLEDDKHSVATWEVLESKGLDWEQDFAAAKQKAAGEHKNVLILFDASDDKKSSFASGRFKEAVAKRKEFQEAAGKKYVCVYVDNPKTPDGQADVKDADRNAKVTKDFCVKVFPTVVVTDPKGRPFGILEGYNVKGVTSFLALMEKWAADGKRLFELLGKFKPSSTDSSNAEVAGEILDFLEINELDRFYAHTMTKATACLPKGEGRPVTKEMADDWMRSLAQAARNPDEAKRVVDKFDRWKKNRTFKDHDMGAQLHLAMAIILARLGPEFRKDAAQKCQEGLALQPHDPMVRAYLDQCRRYLSVEPGQPVLMPVSSGTGYCIAEGNYMLTNHHVIRRAKEITIRLNGQTEVYPAKLIGDDEAGDMALLKVDLPAAKKLTPIPLMANELKIGEKVCVLGWPGVMSQNITLTLTQGGVSTLPASDDNEAFIVTDCTVNPGNSGGPMCSLRGGVAGMVTRKSAITSNQSSYGMAIPISRLRKFLSEKLPHEAHMPSPIGPKTALMEPSDLAEKVQGSVVYIENIQEIKTRAPGQGPEQDEDSEPGE